MDTLTALTLEIARKYPPVGALCKRDAADELIAAATPEEATDVVVALRYEPAHEGAAIVAVCTTLPVPIGSDLATIDRIVADATR